MMPVSTDIHTGDAIRRQTVLVDAGVSFQGESEVKVSLELFWHDVAFDARNPLGFVCLPGGSINRRYYDLGEESAPSFSFARQMAKRGALVIAVDHLGVGASSRPQDGYLLTPDVIVAANAHAVAAAVELLKSGTVTPELPPLPTLATIGVGHSMGGLLTAMQQAAFPLHRAMVLLGFSNAGLIQHLPKTAHDLIGAPQAIPGRIAGLARELYGTAYVEMRPSSGRNEDMFYGGKADRDGVELLKTARDTLIAMPGLQSMIPGSIDPQMKAIDVPVFLGLGDHDIAGPPHAIPASFPASRDVTLLVLPETGHCHFIFPSRAQLFRRLADWVAIVRREFSPAGA
jgi:pimeloyl-ACP methyl ester carboxylesterase